MKNLRERPTRIIAALSNRCLTTCLLLGALTLVGPSGLFAREAGADPPAGSGAELSAARYNVQSYSVEGRVLFNTNALPALLYRYTGTNINLEEMVQAAAEVQAECTKQGFPPVSVAIPQKRIMNGIVPMVLFTADTPQIFVSGKRYFSFREIAELTSKTNHVENTGGTNTATAEAKKPSGPKFEIKTYHITGNTLLSPETIKSVMLKHMGTNESVDDILKAGSDLQKEYRNRGFPTVNVTIPPQQISNGVVKMKVFEGRLSDIVVKNNHYFSSNNVMRSLPSLHTNVILNGPILNGELARANNNQDRSIYAKMEPGPEENTTVLVLDVKDRLPLHAKIELNNQSSPGTPELRLNTSAAYDNLWQEEHSLGVQYSFSPQRYKLGENWNWYDQPLVAIYSGFYRIPLGSPSPLEDEITASPGTFGYNEATQKFVLPPTPPGQPELNFYASRATIDSGINSFGATSFGNSTNSGSASIIGNNFQEDLTVTQDIGTRLTIPLPQTESYQQTATAGLDFKTYEILSHKTNIYTITLEEVNPATGNPEPVPQGTTNTIPLTHNFIKYLPLSVRYDSVLRDSLGYTAFGLGGAGNPWFSGGNRSIVTSITGSGQSTGYYFVLTPSIAREFIYGKGWTLDLRADGQWADQPLINNEQYGIGGVSTVRGYHEGETFGDTGWHVTLEQKTPAYVIGNAWQNNPLVVRGSVYSDVGETYLLDPQGRDPQTRLWGVGLGGVATLGPHFEAHFLFSIPLLRTGLIEPYQPFFNFALDAQF